MIRYSVHVIHAHWLIPQGVVAVLATRWKKHKPKLVCTSHGGDLYGLQDKLSKRLKRWVIRHCQAVTVVSSPMVEKIRELAGGNTTPVSVIPMGTDLDNTFVPNPSIKRHSNQLLFVGRLVEKKGVKYLLQALQKVQQTHTDIRLIIAGSGPLQAELEKLTADLKLTSQVSFTGRLTHRELIQLYQESTMAIFPFVQAKDGDMEGLGLVMVEAMGCGCPVIASDLPAVRDVISHGEAGMLIEPANPILLANAILKEIEHSPIIQPGDISSHRKTNKQFGWKAVTQNYLNCLATPTNNKTVLRATI